MHRLTRQGVHAMSAAHEEDRMDRPAADGASRDVNLTWSAFLAMAFVVVGLCGLFASYAVPLPLQRALARDAALDEAQAAAHGPDPAAALEALRPQLGESADALLPPGPDIVTRITAERSAMRARFLAEADADARRIRLLLAVVTLMAAAFGIAILHMARRAR
jgi:hypothetical protein